jgi:hypothetical protein
MPTLTSAPPAAAAGPGGPARAVPRAAAAASTAAAARPLQPPARGVCMNGPSAHGVAGSAGRPAGPPESPGGPLPTKLPQRLYAGGRALSGHRNGARHAGGPRRRPGAGRGEPAPHPRRAAQRPRHLDRGGHRRARPARRGLAVPSACDTGPGEAAGGGDVFGLQQAFRLGGCRDVVAGLWGVADEPRGAGGPVRARPVGEGAEAAGRPVRRPADPAAPPQGRLHPDRRPGVMRRHGYQRWQVGAAGTRAGRRTAPHPFGCQTWRSTPESRPPWRATARGRAGVSASWTTCPGRGASSGWPPGDQLRTHPLVLRGHRQPFVPQGLVHPALPRRGSPFHATPTGSHLPAGRVRSGGAQDGVVAVK